MANESIRLRTVPGESKNIVVKLDQDFDFLEVLSLKITQEDLYQTFCANYGVVVGRVVANKGFGVPNAKVSVFIPISSEDEKNVLLKDFYPYKSPTDKNSQGLRYNLFLSKTSCYLNKPIGNFPTKETMLDNDIVLEIFDKYYKYTTTSNDAGDFMIFGVPTGLQTVHIDVDLSDIGKLSLRPYDMIASGFPEKMFNSYVEFKASNNLDSLPQVKTSNNTVNVIPFWGDPENCEIGITRTDFDIGSEVNSSAIFFGSIFTDSEEDGLNFNCNPNNAGGEVQNLTTKEGIIDMIRVSSIDDEKWHLNKEIAPTSLETFSIENGELIDEDGVFAMALPMNIGHVITDETGQLIPAPNSQSGIPTKAMYKFKMKFVEADSTSGSVYRTGTMLFPHLFRVIGKEEFTTDINKYNTGYSSVNTQFHTFEWKQVYTIAQYMKKYKKGANRWSFIGIKNTDESGGLNKFPFTTAMYKFDLIYLLLGFLLPKFLQLLLGFFIILFSLCLQICLNITITIFGRRITIIPDICFQVCFFYWLAALIPAFTLPCQSAPNGEGYELPENGATWASCNTEGCSGYSPVCVCPNSPCRNCSFPCFKVNLTGVDTTTNSCLRALENWTCCVKLQTAEERNVIRKVFIDAWVFGTAYFFKFKYRFKPASANSTSGARDKFCGRGANYARATKYYKNKCCLDAEHSNDECDRALLDNGATSDSLIGEGIADIVYSSELMSTKIVSLGRVEMCPDTLLDIESSISSNGVISSFNQTQNQNNIPNSIYFTGTFYEKGWDGNYWVQNLKETSYKNPVDVIFYLATRNGDCDVRNLFVTSLDTYCHEYELKNDNYFFMKEVSKLYTDVEVVEEDANGNLTPTPFNPQSIANPYSDLLNTDDPGYGGFFVNRDLANRFSPCGGEPPGQCFGTPTQRWLTDPNTTSDDTLATSTISFDRITSYTERNNKNTRNNIPYYYFGINPGKTAINKLRNLYFTKK